MSLNYESIIKQMSLEEKALMMSGKNTWETVDFEKYGIPSMAMSDGPHGLRRQAGAGDHLGLNASLPATCFPTAASVANSWDETLGEEIGTALAEEAVTMDVNVILGPGLNIKRSPLCGRNFEYFSEDPYHAGKMAAAYVRGIQSKGIAACPKHFAANSQELRRMANDSVVDERTFREIYTTGFEIAVKEGKAKSIMSSYNEVNGVYANENRHMLQEILVDEWGFDGYVVSDWGGSNDHALGVKNGSHLEMPGTGKSGMHDIVNAVKNGTLEESVLDQRLDELLRVIFATHQATVDGKGTTFNKEAHHKLARKAAEESIVLLKNEEQILPLKQGTKVAVIGDFAKTPRYQGAGSSLVNPAMPPESILEEIKDSGLTMTACEQGYIRNRKPNAKMVKAAVEAAKNADVVLFFGGLDEISESEGLDRAHMHMPVAQDELINELTTVNKNVIVVLSAGSSVEMPWYPYVKGIVHGYLGGQAGASAMLNVLTGKVCPSGKLNETYPLHYEDTPAYEYYPSKERSSEYREGLYVGYRYYNNSNYDPANYNNDSDEMPTTGAKNGMTLADMRGLSYDDEKWDTLLDQLTVSDMDTMIALGGYQTSAASSVGKVMTVDCDGSASINNNFTGIGSIGFPSSVMIANTWNKDLALSFGESIGKMADEMEVSGWYAPAMNTHRNAFAGRNFEYYSEDGVLSGKMAANAVIGAEKYGVYAYIKHFALNDQETNRTGMLCTWSNEQAIREIYLKPFEIAVKEGGAKAVMSSFNYIGTQWAGGTYPLQTTVLRDEWGFRGFVLTDYFGVYGYMDSDMGIRGGTDCMLVAYDTETNHVTDTTSATGVKAMRQASKNIMYTVVNSRAYDPENLKTGLMNWQILAIVIDIILGALVIFLEVLTIRKYKKDAAEEPVQTVNETSAE